MAIDFEKEDKGFYILKNIDKLHSTELGLQRIIRNLSLEETIDAVEYCRSKIQDEEAVVYRKGKNWYIEIDNCVITVNAYNYSIITAHKLKG
jgi:hypothetical protein